MGQMRLWARTLRAPVADWAHEYLETCARSASYRDELVHVEPIARRTPVFAALEPGLPAPLRAAFESEGIVQLYRHQVDAVQAVRAGRDIVVVSGTASGKTVCYNAPILEHLLADAAASTLYLFPTKALAQDQLLALGRLARASPSLEAVMRAGTYDGDTPGHVRRKLRDQANLVLSNPDMLHQAILPYHTRWSRFLASLRYVVIDEVHSYRGIFGSHVANVLRRLLRLCARHGSDPTFVFSSATIKNPIELVERLIGRPVESIDADGSPRGSKLFGFWNPPIIDLNAVERRPATIDAARHFVDLVSRGVQTIVFTKTRITAELVLRYAREELATRDRRLVERVRAYRGGYLPGERREIEASLQSGELLGIVSTNALELGIDIGSLDAAILVGFPPTIASSWQQAGRAGRGERQALVIAVAYDDPIDQYLMRHPRYFFGASPEEAIIDPDNPYVVAGHLGCAAQEQPLSATAVAGFGELAADVCELLVGEGRLRANAGRYFWASAVMPAREVNLRTISDDNYAIVSADDVGRVIATVDGISALELVYPEAIYLHEGVTYHVRELDLEQKLAFVEERAVDYYTQPVLDSWIRVDREEHQRLLHAADRGGPLPDPAGEPVLWSEPAPAVDSESPASIAIDADGSRERWNATAPRAAPVCGIESPRLGLGDAEVSWQTIAMRKIQFRTRDSIGYHTLELPRLTLETRSVWIWIGERLWSSIRARGRQPMESISGLRNLLITLLPIHTMCDPSDLGGVIDTSNTGRPCIFLFDRYPGGLGFCDRAYAIFERLLCACRELLADCPCQSGCPACVGLPVLRPAQQQDPDQHGGWAIPDKAETLRLVDGLLCDAGDGSPPSRPRREATR